jgi:hypothetical protein
MNDQLKEDIRRDELVAEGKLSVEEAEEEAAEWSEVSCPMSASRTYSRSCREDGWVERPSLKSDFRLKSTFC